MPFLVKAKTVEVVSVANEAGKSDEIAGADIGQHLARHGALDAPFLDVDHEIALEAGHTAFAYVYEGAVKLGYRGELAAPAHLPQEAAQRKGHIPGAVNVPASQVPAALADQARAVPDHTA